MTCKENIFFLKKAFTNKFFKKHLQEACKLGVIYNFLKTRKTSQISNTIIQVRNDVTLDVGGRNRGCEKWLNTGYIRKQNCIIADKLYTGREENKGNCFKQAEV